MEKDLEINIADFIKYVEEQELPRVLCDMLNDCIIRANPNIKMKELDEFLENEFRKYPLEKQ